MSFTIVTGPSNKNLYPTAHSSSQKNNFVNTSKRLNTSKIELFP